MRSLLVALLLASLLFLGGCAPTCSDCPICPKCPSCPQPAPLEDILLFLEEDATDKRGYFKVSYNCWHFTADLIEAAQEQGLKCGLVFLLFEEGAHVLVAFDTPTGIVYVEPQNDTIMTFRVGSHYWASNGFPVDWDDEIKSIALVW